MKMLRVVDDKKKKTRKYDHRTLLQRLFGYCPACGKWFLSVETYRQNTEYVEEARNFFTGCRECREENDMFWAEMWAQYYSSVM